VWPFKVEHCLCTLQARLGPFSNELGGQQKGMKKNCPQQGSNLVSLCLPHCRALLERPSNCRLHCASLWSVQRKKRETIVLKGEVKVMMIIVSSRLLELVPEWKANDHVGSPGVDCCWTLHAHASRQHKFIGDALQTTRACQRTELIWSSLTDSILLLFGSAAFTPVIKQAWLIQFAILGSS
jgi:hypothetical protein